MGAGGLVGVLEPLHGCWGLAGSSGGIAGVLEQPSPGPGVLGRGSWMPIGWGGGWAWGWVGWSWQWGEIGGSTPGCILRWPLLGSHRPHYGPSPNPLSSPASTPSPSPWDQEPPHHPHLAPMGPALRWIRPQAHIESQGCPQPIQSWCQRSWGSAVPTIRDPGGPAPSQPHPDPVGAIPGFGPTAHVGRDPVPVSARPYLASALSQL